MIFRDARHIGELVRDIADFRYDGSVVEMLGESNARDPGATSMCDYDLNLAFGRSCSVGWSRRQCSTPIMHGCHGAWLFGVKAT